MRRGGRRKGREMGKGRDRGGGGGSGGMGRKGEGGEGIELPPLPCPLTLPCPPNAEFLDPPMRVHITTKSEIYTYLLAFKRCL